MPRIFHLLVKRFAAGEKPLTMREIAHTLKIPVSLVKEILSELTAIGLAVEITKGIRRDTSFQPGRDIEDMTIKKVLDAYEKRGDADVSLTLTQSDEAEKFSLYMRVISEAIEQSPGNVKLKEI